MPRSLEILSAIYHDAPCYVNRQSPYASLVLFNIYNINMHLKLKQRSQRGSFIKTFKETYINLCSRKDQSA